MKMTSNDNKRVRELIDRLGRIMASDEWGGKLNPTQWTALYYLAKANKFSRSPSQVADFMSATRGTVSKTLKALARKGLVEEVRSEQDKRSISYHITKQAQILLQEESLIEKASSLLADQERSQLLLGLKSLLRATLTRSDFRSFGICKTCTHHQEEASGGFCILLGEALSAVEAQQICHEHTESAQ